jgi:L-threonylcarbamoyladenylate synthase
MKILSKKEFFENNTYLNSINSSVFIYPTDTIYGIGCNALDDKAVSRIRNIKKRDEKPFSVIAPSKTWILENCEVEEKELENLPGPYTFVLKQKNKTVSKFVNPGTDLLGVRIPNHWISEIVSKLDFPIVTTSVNISGKKHMSCIDDLEEDIKNKVDFIIYEGEKKGSPSTIIKIIKGKKEIIKR